MHVVLQDDTRKNSRKCLPYRWQRLNLHSLATSLAIPQFGIYLATSLADCTISPPRWPTVILIVLKCFNRSCFNFLLDICCSKSALAKMEMPSPRLRKGDSHSTTTVSYPRRGLRISFVRMQLVRAVPLLCKSIALLNFALFRRIP